jgi:tetratricopeptide (TPR) repeat protein
METWLAKAEAGERQTVFVTGESGIGKTTLVDLFVETSEVLDRMRMTSGQCLERYGEGEAYLPVLEAVGRLCRDPGGNRLIELLGQYAPSWLVQMPALIDDAGLESLQKKVHGTTHERMLREITEAIEAFTSDRGLVLVLEDLQWSDYSTMELVSYLAHRRERARLMVIGTYRPAEVARKGHPLLGVKRELAAHGQCEEIALELLTATEVDEYVAQRVPHWVGGDTLGQLIHQRTDGNALFMVKLVDFALAQGLVSTDAAAGDLAIEQLEQSVPDTLRQMIQKQIEALDDNVRAMLEVASVAGAEFSAAAVAAGFRTKPEQVETDCDALSRHGHLLRQREIREWPDGTVSSCYAFIHGIYQHVLYEQMGEARRVRIHRLIGKRKEAAYGSRTTEVAAELALHFEWGREFAQAAHYHRVTGEIDLQRSAYREGAGHFARGLELLDQLPEGADRDREEVRLQAALGDALVPIQGVTPEVDRAYERAWHLCQQIGEPPQVFRILSGLCATYSLQGKVDVALDVATELLKAAAREQDTVFTSRAHLELGLTQLWRGELADARTNLERSLETPTTDEQASPILFFAPDATVDALCALGVTLCVQGSVDQALAKIQEALARAEDTALGTFDQAAAHLFAALVHQFRQEPEATRAEAEALLALSTREGFPLGIAGGTILRGWTSTALGDADAGIRDMLAGLQSWQATGARVLVRYFLALISEAQGKAGRVEDGLTSGAGALVDLQTIGPRFYEAELYRVRGELLLLGPDSTKGTATRSTPPPQETLPGDPETCFRQALEIAERQGARAWALRAATSLARFQQHRPKSKEARDARDLLRATHGQFTEGLYTADVAAAAALLD